ncbi:Rad52/Rad22 family DNA repair protein [Ilyobacter sp.]|uniref:Rad52/Rad22 family DNA repair protein n=1 Tax=Ilyobacter sp. TaxID=3100343 RepID=UPI003569FE26
MNKTIDQIMKELKAPFKEDKLEFRVGATNSDKTMGLALCYVEARAIQNRLDEVVSFNNWQVSYKEVHGGFLCSMSLRINGEWIEKQDGAQVTDYEAIKVGISSAFKRVAASGWGIGRYLYDVRNQWFPIKQRGKGYEFAVTPKISNEDKGSIPTEDSNAVKESHQDKLQRAKTFELTFGKYTGKTLGEIFESDKKYIQYIIDKSKDPSLVNACKYLEIHLLN